MVHNISHDASLTFGHGGAIHTVTRLDEDCIPADLELRLLNVVEEMPIASGVPGPN
jgi:hypothetical protein